MEEARLFQAQIASPWISLQRALAELVVVTGKAYEAYPQEANIYEARHAVQKNFTAKSAPPAQALTSP